MQSLRRHFGLKSYFLLYAVLAEFDSQVNNLEEVATLLRKALEIAELKSEQSLLSKHLKDCEERR